MPKSIEVLLLSRADVLALELSPREVVEVVTAALREHAAGTSIALAQLASRRAVDRGIG